MVRGGVAESVVRGGVVDRVVRGGVVESVVSGGVVDRVVRGGVVEVAEVGEEAAGVDVSAWRVASVAQSSTQFPPQQISVNCRRLLHQQSLS